jgi:hypothetical protein
MRVCEVRGAKMDMGEGYRGKRLVQVKPGQGRKDEDGRGVQGQV